MRRSLTGGSVRLGVIGALVAVTLVAPAAAQDGQPEDAAAQPGDLPQDAPASTTLPALPPPPPQPWSESHRWRSTGWTRPVISVAITGSGALLAMTRDGAVLRAPPGGSWRTQLASALSEVDSSADEEILLETQAAVDELVDAPSSSEVEEVEEAWDEDTVVDLTEDEIDLVSDEAEAVAEQASTEVEDSDEIVLDVSERLEEEVAGPAVGVVWTSPEDLPGVALAGRSEGLWRSADDGATWDRVSPAAGVTAVLHLGGGRLLAGGADGLGLSDDAGRRWRRVRGVLEERQVLALALVGEVVLAGTEAGLYQSLDGERWTALAPDGWSDLVVTDLLADPAWEGGFWAATSAGVLRSDDLGQSLRPASRNPLVGTLDLVALGQVGHLLAAGSRGPWESTDGGLTWQALPSGLPGPETRSLAVWGPLVILGGDDGVAVLGRAPALSEQEFVEERRARPPGPPLFEVVGRALERPGLDLDVITIGGRLLAAQLAPRFQVSMSHRVSRYRNSLFESLRTEEHRAPETDIEAQLCWGACSSVDATYDIDSGSTIDAGEYETSEVADFAVIDGQVYDLADSGAISSAAANVAQRATGYRTDVARIVSEVYLSRERLLDERPVVTTLPLQEQVAHSLLIDELTARLDVYTDGWFSRGQPDAAASPN